MLCRAEGIYHQLASSQDILPNHIREILGFSVQDGVGGLPHIPGRGVRV